MPVWKLISSRLWTVLFRCLVLPGKDNKIKILMLKKKRYISKNPGNMFNTVIVILSNLYNASSFNFFLGGGLFNFFTVNDAWIFHRQSGFQKTWCIRRKNLCNDNDSTLNYSCYHELYVISFSNTPNKSNDFIRFWNLFFGFFFMPFISIW